MSLRNLLTPCFIFDEIEFERGIRKFRDALMDNFRDVAIGYSVKTNSLPYAMRKARSFGCMAEVVSKDEYLLARMCGYAPCEIIYNGPMKSKETFLEAIIGGGIVNLEAKREVDWLKELPADATYSIGVRLNINISRISIEDADGDNDNSRFGFSDESNEFAEVVSQIQSMCNVRLAGLHIHRTTHSRSPHFYEHSVNYAIKIAEKYSLELEYLDVGGGYFGIFPKKPTFVDYSSAISTSLRNSKYSNVKIIVEPGNALTASSFSFLTEVIDVKQIDSKTNVITTDGSRNDIDPFFRKTDYIKELFYKDSAAPMEHIQIVAGCTCLEYDRLFTLIDKPRLSSGDRIMYHNVGAYTMTLSPQFIRLSPTVYALENDGSYTEVRRAGCASDLLQLDK